MPVMNKDPKNMSPEEKKITIKNADKYQKMQGLLVKTPRISS